MKSYLTHLECTYCSVTQSADVAHRVCPDCGKVLYPRYDLALAKKALDRSALKDRAANMWRYFEVMPILDEANVITLGEGYTPIFQAARLGEDMGASSLYIKDEGLNPTASFKARGLSAAVSKAKELGITKLTMPSAGNAAGAMTSYAAKGGMEAYVFMPKDVPEANRQEVLITGGNLTLVDGLISDAGQASKARAAEEDLFDVSTLQEPYRVEGKKTMGYEIAEQMGWTLPDAIIYPTGGGTGIVGMWKAFAEMEEMGWIGSERPKMFAVQSDGCAPIVRAFDNGDEFAEPWQNAATMAAGIRVPAAIGDYLILGAIRESGGGALTVTDDEILRYMRKVASLEGMFICPEGAATAAALSKLLSDGRLSSDDNILLLNTGSGLKYLEVL
ncbi:MAG: threonine synthase [SAR202 cluster bacterium]|jgi:threonine synthase|nr:threonine synthase [Chloroflexota bacterium]MDP6665387.1 threonine synthase [SAR202 cluster bacterium]MQG58063.1 threonine synthase [SAR202 cluster bacterium]MQG67829.1 threonine synthase [SAR202 cluster bacterium]HAL49039.1 threonine synthase [Dehalococcoidia bacterium]|tara:strand:+ start:10176 stop:11342 length:1167 start_codon:yes stop_codon:yes gene_type:complete